MSRNQDGPRVAATQLIVVVSFLFNLVVVAWVLYHVSALKSEFAGKQGTELFQIAGAALGSAAIAALPWLYAFSRAGNAKHIGGALLIAVVSVIACIVFIMLGKHTPTEALSYNIFFYLLTVWGVAGVVAIKS